MIAQTDQKTKVLIVDNRLSGPEQEIQREIIKLNGLIDNLSIDIVASDDEYIFNKSGTHYDIVMVGAFDEFIKKEILNPSRLKENIWAFQYNGKPDSDEYLNMINIYKKYIF